MANDYDRAKKKLQADNEFLRNQIRPSTGTKISETNELGKSNNLQKNLMLCYEFLDAVKECERFKKKIQELINEFARKRKELLDTFDGKPDVNMLIRKQDWLIVLYSLYHLIN